MPQIGVDQLRLDPLNPRLPESLHGAAQSLLFEELYQHGVLDELVESMIDNGFFEHEPLIVLPADKDENHTVVEGNRRLAALMLIHEHPATEGFLPSAEVTDANRSRLSQIPCHIVEDREEVRRFLGYRHISGLKPWRPEAKARYLKGECDRAATEGIDFPFRHVGRMVGSNALGVRNSYIALALLTFGREECGANISYILSDRFGVWLRCMNSSEIRNFVGFGSPKTYSEVRAALGEVDCSNLAQVVSDLTPNGLQKALLADSRSVTQYGLILQDERARSFLRKHRSLELAEQFISKEELPEKVARVARQIDALTEELQSNLQEADQALLIQVAGLLQKARILDGVAQALKIEDDD